MKKHYDIGGIYISLPKRDKVDYYWIVFNTCLRDASNKNNDSSMIITALEADNTDSTIIDEYKNQKEEIYFNGKQFVFCIDDKIVSVTPSLNSVDDRVFGEKILQLDLDGNLFNTLKTYLLNTEGTRGYKLLDKKEEMINWIMKKDYRTKEEAQKYVDIHCE